MTDIKSPRALGENWVGDEGGHSSISRPGWVYPGPSKMRRSGEIKRPKNQVANERNCRGIGRARASPSNRGSRRVAGPQQTCYPERFNRRPVQGIKIPLPRGLIVGMGIELAF